MVELCLLAPELCEALGVDDGLGRITGEDRHGRQVIGPEAVPTKPREDDDAADDALEGHRHHEHRFRAFDPADHEAPPVRLRVADDEGLVVEAYPAGEADPEGHPQHVRRRIGRAHEGALESDRLADPGEMVDLVDADRVELDEGTGLGDDCLGDPAHSREAVEARREILDRAQAGRQGLDRFHEAGIAERGGDAVREASCQVDLVGRPVVARIVVQDEHTVRFAAEDDRHEAGTRDALLPVELTQRGCDAGILQVAKDERPAAADRPQACRVGR